MIKEEKPEVEEIMTSMEWTDDDVIALTDAMMSGGKLVLPLGINKHFNMVVVLRRFQNATKKRVAASVLWDRLDDLYDMPRLDKIHGCPFPNEETEFTLPEKDFRELIRDRKGQTAQDKLLDEDSRDSGSGRETPPTLPIAKRGAVQLGTKRKYSSSFSETGSEGGGSTSGRKSSSTSSGTPKPKRRM